MSELRDDQIEKEVREAVQAVWLRRKDRVMSRVDVIAIAVDSLLDGSVTDSSMAAARVEAHNLAGALGSFGFRRGSEIAERIEGLISDREPAVESSELMRELVADLRDELS